MRREYAVRMLPQRLDVEAIHAKRCDQHGAAWPREIVQDLQEGDRIVDVFEDLEADHQIGVRRAPGNVFRDIFDDRKTLVPAGLRELGGRFDRDKFRLRKSGAPFFEKDAETRAHVDNAIRNDLAAREKRSQMINALSNSTVPHVTVIMGASYGAGNYGMGGRAFDTRFVFLWPTAKIAIMGPKQMAGVMSIVRRERAVGALPGSRGHLPDLLGRRVELLAGQVVGHPAGDRPK